MALKRVNAVVVGAGAGGGIVAKELAEAGFTVALLERGKWYTAFDCRKDDLRNQRTTVLGCAFGPDDERYRRVVLSNPTAASKSCCPSDGAYNNNAACVGGGTFSYGAMAWRFMEKDFRMRSDLRRRAWQHPRRLAHHLPGPGALLRKGRVGNRRIRRRHHQYFQGAAPQAAAHAAASAQPRAPTLKAAAKRLGLHPFDIPMLRNTVPYNGRGACMRCRWCVGFACEVDAKCGTHNTVIPRALATGNCDLRTECVVQGNPDRRARPGHRRRLFRRRQPPPGADSPTSSSFLPPPRNRRACCSTPKARTLPNGLGNRYDWVGRNLKGHAYSGALGLLETDTYDDSAPALPSPFAITTTAIPAWSAARCCATSSSACPFILPSCMPPDVPRWGAGAQGIHAPCTTVAPSSSWARCRKCRCSTRACKWIPP